MQPGAISFVLILLLGAVVALVVGIFLPRRRQTWNALLAGAVLVVAGAAAALKLGAPPGLVFDQSYAVDGPALWTVLALVATGLLCIALALPAFRKASALDETDTVSLCMIGYALERLGKPEQAIPYYSKALKLKPNDEMANKFMATVNLNE